MLRSTVVITLEEAQRRVELMNRHLENEGKVGRWRLTDDGLFYFLFYASSGQSFFRRSSEELLNHALVEDEH